MRHSLARYVIVLQLHERLEIGPQSRINQLKLPEKSHNKYLAYDYEEPIIAGFGFDQIRVQREADKLVKVPTGSFDTLRFARATVIPNEIYLSHYKDSISSNHLIAKIEQVSGTKGVCKVCFIIMFAHKFYVDQSHAIFSRVSSLVESFVLTMDVFEIHSKSITSNFETSLIT